MRGTFQYEFLNTGFGSAAVPNTECLTGNKKTPAGQRAVSATNILRVIKNSLAGVLGEKAQPLDYSV